jgi:hypothetical protein
MLSSAMATWASKRQPVTAISSTESEFYSASQCALECVYLRRVMDLMGYPQTGPTLIAQDNNACIFLVKGSGMYARAKHIDTRVHRVREFAAGLEPQVGAPVARPDLLAACPWHTIRLVARQQLHLWGDHRLEPFTHSLYSLVRVNSIPHSVTQSRLYFTPPTPQLLFLLSSTLLP